MAPVLEDMHDDWRPRGHPEVQTTTLPDGTWVIYHPDTSMAHVLNASAGVVWEHCDGAHSLSTLGDVLADYFPDAAAEARRQAVGTILARFLQVGVVLAPPDDRQAT